MPKQLSIFILFIVFVIPPLAQAEVTSGIELNAEERTWISENPHFKVGASPLGPYVIESGNRATGYMVDLLQAIAHQVGLEPDFQFLPLIEIMNQLREGTVDVSMALLHNKAREKFLHFSQETVTVNLSIFAQKGSKGITGLKSLSGKTLASYQSYALNPVFKKYLPDVNILMAKDIKGMFSMVAMGEADALIQEPNTGNYLLRRWLINNIETTAFAVFAGKKDYQSHYYAVGKHAPLLASILDKSHRFMPEREKQRLWNRWFTTETTIQDDKLLSAEEEAYLDRMTFKRAQANGWIPFNFNSNDGDIIGINEDYWVLIRSKLGIKEVTNSPLPFAEILQVMKQGQVDLLVGTTRTKERETYAVFSDSYEEFPIAIACRDSSHEGFITNASVLEGEVVAVGRNYSAYHMLKTRYPGIKFLQVNDTREALEKVASGEAYAAIDILPSLEYQVKKYPPEEIKISGVTDISFPLQVMVNKEHARLLPLINRAIAAISPQEHLTIYKKWMMRNIITAPDYTLLSQVLGVALLIIGIILYWNRRLAREVARRKQTEIALHESDTRYRLAMDATQDGVWDWDLITGEVNYSLSWRHIIGDEITGNDYLTWESRIHPDDKPRILETLRSHLAGDSP
ncbi:MAG: transporter substrate-binding domain-containing protein, partial [Gammaproteobacteria bacterium]|nr:transporter substrate-binding domain-containing protein [Gammaproteobacteria bacterium]